MPQRARHTDTAAGNQDTWPQGMSEKPPINWATWYCSMMGGMCPCFLLPSQCEKNFNGWRHKYDRIMMVDVKGQSIKISRLLSIFERYHSFLSPSCEMPCSKLFNVKYVGVYHLLLSNCACSVFTCSSHV